MLDRDGTLIKHVHYLIDPKEVELLPKVIEGLKYLKNLGFSFGVITNQSVIGRGMCTYQEVESINKEVSQLLLAQGISLTFTLVCPHTPEDACSCRKPAPGLGIKAILEFDVDHLNSFMLGDQPTDVSFGHAIGCKAIQINKKPNSNSEADYNTETLLNAAKWIESEAKRV